MYLLGFRRNLTALALCKSIESAIQWFQIHHRITFATMQNPAVYILDARVSIFLPWFPDYKGHFYVRRIGLSLHKYRIYGPCERSSFCPSIGIKFTTLTSGLVKM